MRRTAHASLKFYRGLSAGEYQSLGEQVQKKTGQQSAGLMKGAHRAVFHSENSLKGMVLPR
jgi:hypothetical protein